MESPLAAEDDGVRPPAIVDRSSRADGSRLELAKQVVGEDHDETVTARSVFERVGAALPVRSSVLLKQVPEIPQRVGPTKFPAPDGGCSEGSSVGFALSSMPGEHRQRRVSGPGCQQLSGIERVGACSRNGGKE